jgi:hypothetical protein
MPHGKSPSKNIHCYGGYCDVREYRDDSLVWRHSQWDYVCDAEIQVLLRVRKNRKPPRLPNEDVRNSEIREALVGEFMPQAGRRDVDCKSCRALSSTQYTPRLQYPERQEVDFRNSECRLTVPHHLIDLEFDQGKVCSEIPNSGVWELKPQILVSCLNNGLVIDHPGEKELELIGS